MAKKTKGNRVQVILESISLAEVNSFWIRRL